MALTNEELEQTVNVGGLKAALQEFKTEVVDPLTAPYTENGRLIFPATSAATTENGRLILAK